MTRGGSGGSRYGSDHRQSGYGSNNSRQGSSHSFSDSGWTHMNDHESVSGTSGRASGPSYQDDYSQVVPYQGGGAMRNDRQSRQGGSAYNQPDQRSGRASSVSSRSTHGVPDSYAGDLIMSSHGYAARSQASSSGRDRQLAPISNNRGPPSSRASNRSTSGAGLESRTVLFSLPPIGNDPMDAPRDVYNTSRPEDFRGYFEDARAMHAQQDVIRGQGFVIYDDEDVVHPVEGEIRLRRR